jgi:hypothetical protein
MEVGCSAIGEKKRICSLVFCLTFSVVILFYKGVWKTYLLTIKFIAVYNFLEFDNYCSVLQFLISFFRIAARLQLELMAFQTRDSEYSPFCMYKKCCSGELCHFQ